MISSESPNYASACTQHNLCRELSSGGLANEWLVQQKQAFRKPNAFCEQIGHRSFVIVPHEICVIPKGTAPCANSAACAALAQFGESLEKITATELITNCLLYD